MITKQLFCKRIKVLRDYMDREYRLVQFLGNEGWTERDFYLYPAEWLIDEYTDMLAEVVGDTRGHDWVNLFVFDHDFGRTLMEMEFEGEVITVDCPEVLWDIIKSEEV